MSKLLLAVAGLLLAVSVTNAQLPATGKGAKTFVFVIDGNKDKASRFTAQNAIGSLIQIEFAVPPGGRATLNSSDPTVVVPARGSTLVKVNDAKGSGIVAIFAVLKKGQAKLTLTVTRGKAVTTITSEVTVK